MKRKLTAILLLALTTLTLMACGNEPKKEADKTTKIEVKETTETKEEFVLPADELAKEALEKVVDEVTPDVLGPKVINVPEDLEGVTELTLHKDDIFRTTIRDVEYKGAPPMTDIDYMYENVEQNRAHDSSVNEYVRFVEDTAEYLVNVGDTNTIILTETVKKKGDWKDYTYTFKLTVIE